MSTAHGLHTCPTCTSLVGEEHKCKPKIKVSFVTLDVMKEWLDKLLIARSLK